MSEIIDFNTAKRELLKDENIFKPLPLDELLSSERIYVDDEEIILNDTLREFIKNIYLSGFNDGQNYMVVKALNKIDDIEGN